MRRWAFIFGALLTLLAGQAFAQTRIFITSGTTWTVPTDWNSQQNTIEVVGGGGIGGDCGFSSSFGGGGGGYSAISNFSAVPGASISLSFTPNVPGSGIGGVVSFGSGPAVSAEYGNDKQKVCTVGGSALGGQAVNGVGTTKYNGGTGGSGTGGGAGTGSGGGAAGLHGAGNTTGVNSGVGGSGDAGFGGAGGVATTGGNGTEWDASHGSGGGGGSDPAGIGGPGGNYGGGGAYAQIGGPALIVITYTPRNRVSSGVF